MLWTSIAACASSSEDKPSTHAQHLRCKTVPGRVVLHVWCLPFTGMGVTYIECHLYMHQSHPSKLVPCQSHHARYRLAQQRLCWPMGL